MSLEIRAIREEEREEAIQLWCTVWGGESSKPYFSRYFYGDVEWLPYYTIVALLDGKMVSAVQVCKRIVPVGDYRLTMGGIANVATLPEHRGKGYNTECLKKAIEVMEADAMDFSLLFTGINPYYARLGYCDLPATFFAGKIRDDFSPSTTPYTVRLANAQDLPFLFQIYSIYNSTRPITVQRSEAYWRDWIGISADKIPENLFVAESARGEIVGYVRVGHFSSAVPYNENEVEARIIEYGSDPLDSEAIATALLEEVTGRVLGAGTHRLVASLPKEPALQSALAKILESVETRTSGSAMFRLLHTTNLFKSLTFTMNDRWIEAGRPQGSLTFETPYGATRINATGDFLTITLEDNPSEALTQSAFFALLFGISTPESLTSDPLTQNLMRSLFAPHSPTYWGADGF